MILSWSNEQKLLAQKNTEYKFPQFLAFDYIFFLSFLKKNRLLPIFVLQKPSRLKPVYR